MVVTEWVYGWDATLGIVSVWANREGRAVVWWREGGRLLRKVGGLPPLAAGCWPPTLRSSARSAQ
ncbi:hypothetical protein EKD04_007960 [Chloroflexales bacterium ZM16-3]|nr:hypothetical protein [Chloroflexales bacterium ZM16-3]